MHKQLRDKLTTSRASSSQYDGMLFIHTTKIRIHNFIRITSSSLLFKVVINKIINSLYLEMASRLNQFIFTGVFIELILFVYFFILTML